jgi:hypothetical protein
MGKLSRTKGKVFERRVASALRAQWPDAEIRRSSQAERAYEADVFARGAPVLERLWMELQDARNPTPLAKLEQAERDVELRRRFQPDRRYPVVVWHRIRERVEWVTTRLWVLDAIRGNDRIWPDMVVTMQLDPFVEMLKAAA